MELYNPQYIEWDLETTAKLLQSKFKDSTVFVIKPSEMLLNTFSLYRNFLFFDENGRPHFSGTFGAFLHLVKLFENTKEKAVEENRTLKHNTCKISIEEACKGDLPVKLVGFSKGCVVINQLMFELEKLKVIPEVKAFLNHLSAIYWLDGGHVGRKDAYITETEVLKSIVALQKELVIHVSAYQIRDLNSRWIEREEKEFVTKLREMKADIKEFQHFMNEPGSLQNHWKVLTKV